LKRAIDESQGLDVAHAEDHTVATWLRTWYELYAKPNIRVATADRYRLMIETYTIPRIGDIKLTKLASRDLQKLYKDLVEHGRVDPKSGKGELAALLWSDLDIKNRTISVSKQYIKNPNGELTLSRPKTETSVRAVSIPQTAVDLLIQEHEKHPDNPYMFPSPVTGEMYYPDSVVNLHKKILKDAGLEHLRFHDLRHTFATTALQNGVDIKTVSSMLGHYDAGFTLRTYTHATRQKQDEAAETMGCFMEQVM
jgi:integrase